MDQFTKFHTIMGEIKAISIDFDDNTMSILSQLYKEGSLAWSKVEKNSVDPDAWNLTEDDMSFYNSMVSAERNALDILGWELFYGDEEAIVSAVDKLKGPQAQAYLTLGDFINK